MSNSQNSLKLTWLSTFRTPNDIIGSEAFQASDFTNYLQAYCIKFLLTHIGLHRCNKIGGEPVIILSTLLH